MKKLLYFLATGLVLAATSCTTTVSPAIATLATNNPNYPVEQLFTKDGCTMYRFVSEGEYIYWSSCAGTVDAQRTIPGDSTEAARIVHTRVTTSTK